MAREKICGIYKITNLVNGKVYIGQSIDIHRRWNNHKRKTFIKSDEQYNYPLYRAFRKYGLDNFSFEIIEECSEEELNKKEIYYIDLYRTYICWKDSNGYNQTLGGGGSKGYILTGGDNPNSRPVYCDGVKYDSVKEFTQKYNLTYPTVMNWLYKNNYMPQEWYDRGLHFEGENMCDYKIQTGILNGKNHPLSKTVLCEDREFDSIKECADYYGVNKATMTDWVTHKHKMPRKWYDKGLHLKGEDMCSYEYDNKSKVVVCEGIKFYSIRECAEYYGVSKDAMIKWLSGRNKMPQEFKDKGLRYYE